MKHWVILTQLSINASIELCDLKTTPPAWGWETRVTILKDNAFLILIWQSMQQNIIYQTDVFCQLENIPLLYIKS